MMNKDQIIEMTIEDMSVEGQGIGRAYEDEGPGLVVFVPGAIPGDRIRARLTKVKKNYAFGRMEEVLEESPWREPDFGCEGSPQGCGGCPFAMLTYEKQLEVKQKQVAGRLQRIAELEAPVIRPIIGMQDGDNEGLGCFRYRNKAVFQISTGGIITRKGGIVENLGDPAVGFYSPKSHDVVDCGDCCLQSEPAMAAAEALRVFMQEDNITGFDPKWEKGLMRHMIVKTAFGTKEVMVVLVINGKGIPNAPKLIGMLDDAIYETGFSLESVVVNVNKASGKNVEKNKKKDRSRIRVSGEVMGNENIVIAGKPSITDMVGDLRLEISAASFCQVNPAQMKRLYDQVRRYCAPEAPGKKQVILDLYCGIGSIGLYCADLAEMVIGIESVKDAVTDANRNAVINGITGARYICGRAEDVLPAYMGDQESQVKIDPQLRQYIQRTDTVILDPPRAGCRPELLEAAAGTGAEKIIYVSCDPATLARDVKLLGELGYSFAEAVPVDMFPHTGHVETVALIQKRKSN